MGCYNDCKEDEKSNCPSKSNQRDDVERKLLINRLNRIEGQVRGIKKMVEADTYCTDILTQVSAIQSALNAFNTKLLTNHIKTCVVNDIKDGKEDEIMEELMQTLKKIMK